MRRLILAALVAVAAAPAIAAEGSFTPTAVAVTAPLPGAFAPLGGSFQTTPEPGSTPQGAVRSGFDGQPGRPMAANALNQTNG